MKVGSYIGMLTKRQSSDGKEFWKLIESKVTKIIQNSKGTKIYSKGFYPLDAADVEFNTKEQEEAQGYILTREVFELNDITRPKVERWIEWANANMDKAVSILEDV